MVTLFDLELDDLFIWDKRPDEVYAVIKLPKTSDENAECACVMLLTHEHLIKTTGTLEIRGTWRRITRAPEKWNPLCQVTKVTLRGSL